MPTQLDEEKMVFKEVCKIKDQYKGKGLSWNRLRGDAIAKITAHFMQQHLPEDVMLVTCAWVEGCELEFDILVVDRGAEPFNFTNMYPKEKVRLIIEVKGAGVFYKKSEVVKNLTEWKHKILRYTGKPILYISYWESPDYFKMVLKALGKENSFVLEVGNHRKRYEWFRFIRRARSYVSQTSLQSETHQ